MLSISTHSTLPIIPSFPSSINNPYQLSNTESRIVHIIPGQFTGIRECLLQHLLRKLIIMLELQRLMVETDSLIQLPTQVMDKSHREIRLRVGGVQAHALLEVADGVLVFFEFAAGVGQVG